MPTVFFSWQVDRPAQDGRNFVQRALERAAERIGKDTAIEEALRDLEIDRDTKGVSGSPPIVETIFRKIDKAAVFVADVTFVGQRADGRPTPNPNVLIEYGWALKSLNHGRILTVMNTAFGQPTPDAMPFDMRHLRNPILYNCPNDTADELRKQVQQKLSKDLERGIRAIFQTQALASSAAIAAPAVPFLAQEPKDGPGRFRAAGQPLGITAGFFFKPEHEIRLADGPVLWLRVMPLLDQGRTWLVTELKRAATEHGQIVLPVLRAWSNLSFIRNDDGFGVYAPTTESPDLAYAVVFAFASGEIWSADS